MAHDAPGPSTTTGSPSSREGEDAQLEADARALASVVRMRILRLCLDEALTNKEIADRLGKDPATTFHHVRTLAERGFLAAGPERRGARGAREVPYRATGRSWRAPRGPELDQVLINTFLEEVRESDPHSLRTIRLGLRLDAAGRDELERRIVGVLQEFVDRPSDPHATPYSIFYALHEDAARSRPASTD